MRGPPGKARSYHEQSSREFFCFISAPSYYQVLHWTSLTQFSTSLSTHMHSAFHGTTSVTYIILYYVSFLRFSPHFILLLFRLSFSSNTLILCIRYDPLSSCLVDFKGRANMASVKNFQLVHSSSAELDTKRSQEVDAEKDYILQVGKVCDNAV